MVKLFFPKKPTLAERLRKQTLAERLQPKPSTPTERLAQDAVQRANNQRIHDETRKRSAEMAERARKTAHDAQRNYDEMRKRSAKMVEIGRKAAHDAFKRNRGW